MSKQLLVKKNKKNLTTQEYFHCSITAKVCIDTGLIYFFQLFLNHASLALVASWSWNVRSSAMRISFPYIPSIVLKIPLRKSRKVKYQVYWFPAKETEARPPAQWWPPFASVQSAAPEPVVQTPVVPLLLRTSARLVKNQPKGPWAG